MRPHARLCIYYFQEAFQNLFRGGWLTVSAIGTITFALVIIGLFFLLSTNLDATLSGFRAESLIVAYLEEDLQSYDQERIMTEIKRLPEVAEVTLVTKDENLRRFQDDLGDLSDILNELDSNPLPASFEVKLNDADADIAAVAGRIDLLDGVEDVDYGRQALALLSRIGMGIRFLILVVGVVLGLAALFIIANTIRLTVLSRRDEIEIMRLVGATDWYIRWPYFIEGLVEGLLASLFATGLLFAFYQLVLLQFPLLPYLPVKLSFFSFTLCARLILIGALIGSCGSLIALHHVLREVDEA